MSLSLSQQQIEAFRLERAYLTGSDATPITIASKLAGIQAQVFSAAKLSLGLRSNSTSREIEKLFLRPNGIVKTWAMRGTLYALSANDLSLFCSAIGYDAIERYIKHWKRYYNIKETDSERLIEAIGDSLSLEPKTRKEISLEVSSSLGEWGKPLIESGWGGAVKCHCELGNAVFSEIKGTETSFVLKEKYVKRWKQYSHKDAFDEILRRYLAAYGPSNMTDFGYWIGKQMPVVREVWSRVLPEMTEIEYGTRKGYILKKDIRAIRNAEPAKDTIRLLPLFDVYLLAHRKKEHLVNNAHYKKIYRNAGWISQTILFNGKAIGVWELQEKKKILHIRIKAFERLTNEQKSLFETEKTRLENYLEQRAWLHFR
ncbi:MAG TPA: winged helix DNA-binding domain-containing protein [Candidatus Kapabacteria bacterium]|nr:winged helix DNA-binding domain-containing protein [Candidatus Kapabacteria bacterium]